MGNGDVRELRKPKLQRRVDKIGSEKVYGVAEHFRNGTFGALPLLKHDADSFTLVKNELHYIYPTRLRKVISARTFDLFCLENHRQYYGSPKVLLELAF